MEDQEWIECGKCTGCYAGFPLARNTEQVGGQGVAYIEQTWCELGLLDLLCLHADKLETGVSACPQASDLRKQGIVARRRETCVEVRMVRFTKPASGDSRAPQLWYNSVRSTMEHGELTNHVLDRCYAHELSRSSKTRWMQSVRMLVEEDGNWTASGGYTWRTPLVVQKS